MSFFVVAEQRRYRVSTRNGEEFAFLFRKKPARRIFKEEFATRGGGETFCELVERAQIFRNRREIPGSTRYFVVTREELECLK